MRLFVALIFLSVLAGAQSQKQPAKSASEPHSQGSTPQPTNTIIEIHRGGEAVTDAAQNKNHTTISEAQPFMTHGEIVMSILTAIYVGISLFSLRAIMNLSDHFKSGQRLSLQKRPTGLAVQD